MAKFLGLDFAPLNVPWKRRMETLAVIQWMFTFLLMGACGLALLIYLCFTDYYWLSLLYATWWLYDRPRSRRGGMRSEWLRHWKIWEHLRDYFPMKLIKTADLDPDRNYIFGYHPHGVLSAGAFLNFAVDVTGFSKLFPGLTPTLLTLEGIFMMPIQREYVMSAGICDCSKASINYLLTEAGKGNAVTIVVGGAAESLEAKPNNYVVKLKDRKGFVKMALQNGASLVPVYSFGEIDMYVQADNSSGTLLRRIQDKLSKLIGFAPVIGHGRGIFNYTFGLLPFRRPVNVVVGKPIHLDRVVAPSIEQIQDLHRKYMAGLNELFDENKTKYGIDESVHLKFT